MSVYLDIVFSILIGSALLLMIFTYNADMVATAHINNLYSATQENSFSFQEILRNDFKKIGLSVPDTSTVFSIADSTQVKFKADLHFDDSVEEILYYVGDLSSADFTDNPNDRIMYRKVDNNTPETYTIGIINLNFAYYDEDGNQTANLNDIKQIGYDFYVESTYGYDGKYPGTFIRGRINLKNVK